MLKLFLFSFICVQFNQIVLAQETKDVTVSVYYETLCPDSKAFITHQLYPTYLEMGSLFSLHLVPYGKASKSKNNGKWSFSCQHGKLECDGNKRHACALKDDKIPESNKMQFIDCTLHKFNIFPQAAENCAIEAKINWDDINSCSISDQGSEYLAEYGVETEKLVESLPGRFFVPTIVFNNEFKEADQDKALENFKEVLCSYLGPNTTGC